MLDRRAAAGLVVAGLGATVLVVYLRKSLRKKKTIVRAAPFDAEIETALNEKMKDGDGDFLPRFWSRFATDAKWTL